MLSIDDAAFNVRSKGTILFSEFDIVDPIDNPANAPSDAFPSNLPSFFLRPFLSFNFSLRVDVFLLKRKKIYKKYTAHKN